MTLSAEGKKNIMRRFSEEVWTKGSMAVMDQLVSPDLLDHNPFPGVSPGREGYKQTVEMMRAAFPDFSVHIVSLLVEGDKAVDHWEGTGTHQNEFMGTPPTGKRFTMSGIGIARLGDDDRIVERWAQFSLIDALQQLGVIPGGGGEKPPVPPPPKVEGGGVTSEAENKEIMRRQTEEIRNEGKMDVADDLFHPQAIAPYAPELPPGPAGCKAVATMFRDALPDFHITIEDMIADGDMVCTRLRQTGTHNGELFNIPATGKSVDFEEICLVRVAGGRIITTWSETDMASLMGQLGVIPPMG